MRLLRRNVLLALLALLAPVWGQSRGLREVVLPSGQRLSLYDGSHAVVVGGRPVGLGLLEALDGGRVIGRWAHLIPFIALLWVDPKRELSPGAAPVKLRPAVVRPRFSLSSG